MDQLPDSYSVADNSNADESSGEGEESSKDEDNSEEDSVGYSSIKDSPAPFKPSKECIKTKEDDTIMTNLESLIKIVVLNKDKLVVFSNSKNWFVGLKNK